MSSNLYVQSMVKTCSLMGTFTSNFHLIEFNSDAAGDQCDITNKRKNNPITSVDLRWSFSVFHMCEILLNFSSYSLLKG